MKLTYKTVITARDRGDFLVERLCENKVVDRYTTFDLKIPRKNIQPWMHSILVLANTPFAPDPRIVKHNLEVKRRNQQRHTEIANLERVSTNFKMSVSEYIGFERQIQKLHREMEKQ